MKKFLTFVCVLSIASFAFAKGNLSLDIGAQYANNQLHRFGKEPSNKFHNHNIRLQHMGGFNLGVNYEIAKNWGIFLNSAFSFNNVFLNDTVLGFGYTFAIPKAPIKLFLGGGLALGGFIYDNNIASVKTRTSHFNLGAGLQLVGSYMFTNMFGCFFGADLNYYGVLSGKEKTTVSSATNTSSISKSNLPDLAKTFHLKAGLRIAF
ncbi:MAG: hypothetical protein P1P64_08020 [Treponemataceae bacterium]